MIKNVTIPRLMRNLKTTADGYRLSEGPDEWFRMLEQKLSDRQTPSIIRAIQARGFIDPICVTVDDYDKNFWELGNGHHRLCVAIMLGMYKIPVDFSDWYSNESTAHSDDIVKKYGDGVLADWIASFWTDAHITYPGK